MIFEISITIFALCGLVWLLGIIGNSALIFTYRSKGLTDRFNQLMVLLAVFDGVFLLTAPAVIPAFHMVGSEILATSPTMGSTGSNDELAAQLIAGSTHESTSESFSQYGKILLNILVILNQSALKGSIFTTIALSADKYLTECLGINTAKHTIWVTIGAISTLALLLSLPSPSFYFDIQSYNYLIGTMAFHFVITGLLPFAFLICLNVNLWKLLKECDQHLHSQSPTTRFSINMNTAKNLQESMFQTKLSMINSFIFISSQTLSWGPLIYMISSKSDTVAINEYVKHIRGRMDETASGDEEKFSVNTILWSVAFLLYILCSASNFYIYKFLYRRQEKNHTHA